MGRTIGGARCCSTIRTMTRANSMKRTREARGAGGEEEDGEENKEEEEQHEQKGEDEEK